jgi:hypothetical protein
MDVTTMICGTEFVVIFLAIDVGKGNEFTYLASVYSLV